MVESENLNDGAKQVLAALGEHGPLTTKQLRMETDLESNQLVLYRCDEHLLPADLIEDIDVPGQSRGFALTDAGKRYLEQHVNGIDRPQTLADVVDEMDALEDEIDTLRDRVQEAQGTVNTYDQQIEGVERHLNVEIEDVRRWIRGEEKRTNELKEDLRTDIRELDEDLQSLSDGLQEALDETEENLKDKLESERARLTETEDWAEAQLKKLEEKTNANARVAEQFEETMEETTETADQAAAVLDRGLLGRLYWLLTGR